MRKKSLSPVLRWSTQDGEHLRFFWIHPHFWCSWGLTFSSETLKHDYTNYNALLSQSHKIQTKLLADCLLVRSCAHVCLWAHTVIGLSLRAARLFCLRTWNTSAGTVSQWPWTAQNTAASTISAEDIAENNEVANPAWTAEGRFQTLCHLCLELFFRGRLAQKSGSDLLRQTSWFVENGISSWERN